MGVVARERRLTAILVAALVAVLVIGLGSAFAIGRSGSVAWEGTTAGDGGGSTGDSTGSAGPGTSAGTGASAPGGSNGSGGSVTGTAVRPTGTGGRATAAPESSAPEAPAAGASGTVDVTLSAEAQSSRYADEVQSLLQRYFEAINAHDFHAWTQTVTANQSAHWAAQSWEHDYSTTEDVNVYVSDIIDEATQTAVRIQFVSHQQPDFAPTSLRVTCINWDVIYRLERVDGQLRVGNSTRDPYLVACR